MPTFNSLGDRMKFYENRYTSIQFIPSLPVLARIDGRAFHTFTKNFQKPFDYMFSGAMREVTEDLVKESGAKWGYTQSDEISLLFYYEDPKSQLFFDGNLQKMCSVLASLTTSLFGRIDSSYQKAIFDCRVWDVPSKEEAVNYFIWREQDAVRNSIQMAARSIFSHKECENKNGSQLQDMLMDKGINWNNYPAPQKRGSYFSWITEFITDPEFTEEYTNIQERNLPILTTIDNRVDVFFHGAQPKIKEIECQVPSTVSAAVE